MCVYVCVCSAVPPQDIEAELAALQFPVFDAGMALAAAQEEQQADQQEQEEQEQEQGRTGRWRRPQPDGGSGGGGGPIKDGNKVSFDVGMPVLQRYTLWAILRGGGSSSTAAGEASEPAGRIPGPLPEGAAAWVGSLAVRSVALLSGPRAAPAADGRLTAAQLQQLAAAAAAPGSAVVVAPPAFWLESMLACQAAAMMLGAYGGAGSLSLAEYESAVGHDADGAEAGEPWRRQLLQRRAAAAPRAALLQAAAAQRAALLQAAAAARAWALPPVPEWGEAFLRASRLAFLSPPPPPLPQPSRQSSPPAAGVGPGASAADAADTAAAVTGPGGGDGSGGDGGSGGSASCLSELLQLLLAAVALDMQPGEGWLRAAEATSVDLMRGGGGSGVGPEVGAGAETAFTLLDRDYRGLRSMRYGIRVPWEGRGSIPDKKGVRWDSGKAGW